MGNLNCQTCDCTQIDKSHQIQVQLPYQPSDSSFPSLPSSNSTPLQIPIQSLKPWIPRLQALWKGYTDRKHARILRKQRQLNHSYFSSSQIHQTLLPNTFSSSFRERKGPYTYKSGAKYTGDWLGGFRDGKGTIVYPNGAKYSGQWSYGVPFGEGEFVHVDGDIYQGKWNRWFISPRDTFGSGVNFAKWKDLISDGFLWLWLKQEIFKHEPPKNSVKTKIIRFKKENQESTEASIREKTSQYDMTLIQSTVEAIKLELQGNIQKQEELLAPIQNQETREFGHHRYQDTGTLYIGQWKSGLRDGRGKQIWVSGDIYQGEWQNDQQNGLGKMTYVSQQSYFGYYLQNEKHGIGKFEWADGTFYVGEFQRDQMNGLGEIKWKDGRVYTGYIREGQRDQYGTMKYANGSKFEGEFFNDKIHGFGTHFGQAGKTTRGVWKNNKLIKDP